MKFTKKYCFLILTSAILGATIAPVMFFIGLEQTTAADTHTHTALSIFTQHNRIGVVKASSILSLSAVFGCVLAGVFLNETISVFQIVAIAIMLLGIQIMYTREKKIEVQY